MQKAERGFTYLEVLVAMVITSLVIGLVGTGLYHFLIVPALQGDHLTAVNELRFALDTIQADGVQAHAFTLSEATDEYGYFDCKYYDLDQGKPVAYTITYSYDSDGGRLRREVDGGSAAIASHIAAADDVVFALNEEGGAVLVTITVTVDSGRGQTRTESGTRKVVMRLGS